MTKYCTNYPVLTVYVTKLEKEVIEETVEYFSKPLRGFVIKAAAGMNVFARRLWWIDTS